MSLRYALLALLNVEPMTGYDLYKVFESSVGHVWHAPDSQIYPELKRMESEGLLLGEDIPWGQRGKKRQYHVTKAGTEAFSAWMNTTMEYARVREPAHLRAAYMEWAEPEAAREQMRAHIKHHKGLLEQWREKVREIEEGSSPMLNRRLANTPSSEQEKTTAFKAFAYEGLISQAEAEVSWAKRGLKLIDRLNP
ncbi:PadR family transcriptional regulator [Paeniglutamicibacter cryotolerans]|uniref:DNA-binding PadR family transcriptional regulator n=1 Tax=Paeniglutamicibacter cryotolerans TaxID=670079 RepID=A0A839QE21_9MICC|nr:PadR family transcriptional regulator [Paeniglutamicibacter cryotolerans]MBB2994488.1 DNA-binding PadR family transcriptional regulator [Paeniglutamicibacter cryotolerans]